MSDKDQASSNVFAKFQPDFKIFVELISWLREINLHHVL